MEIPCEVLKFGILVSMIVDTSVQLTNEQEQILMGSLLGDACMEKNGSHYRVKFDHSIAQEGYLYWKYEKLANYATSILSGNSYDSRTDKYYKHVRFNTKSHEIFDKYYRMFYGKGRKCVPLNIKNLLTSKTALAVWYLDDGAKRTDCNALRIHTNCYPVAEQEVLLEMLEVNFGIVAKLHKVHHEEYVIYIPSDNAKKFCKLIQDVITEIPDMRYKLI